MLIRPATDADWERIWPFWQAIVAEGESYVYPDDATPEQARAIWMPGGPMHTVVAVDFDGRVLGSATMGPNKQGRGDHVATASVMVDPVAQGQRIGRQLGEHVIAWAADAGFRSIQFNAVVETNAAAVALWRDLGFRVVGTVPEAFRSASHGLVGLHVMHRSLT